MKTKLVYHKLDLYPLFKTFLLTYPEKLKKEVYNLYILRKSI
ncbi:hypothetical protein B488_02920 [Liberibacter crescens BT-1]|uniref:Uncharacterized protein n=1 Tax=Liberibacter crescens (strain BT-1) TaxID=1215343 RepID=L0ETW1_LIBCB|nr:hypothetical protein B488_02920 [Liberibacter crescens BT-1]